MVRQLAQSELEVLGVPVRSYLTFACRVLQRMTPVSATAHADVDSLQRIAYNILESTFAPQGYTMEQRDRDPVVAVSRS